MHRSVHRTSSMDNLHGYWAIFVQLPALEMVRQRDHQRSLPWDQVPSSFEPRTVLGCSSRFPELLQISTIALWSRKKSVKSLWTVGFTWSRVSKYLSVLDNWFISDLNSLSHLLSAPNHQAYIDTPCHVDVHKPILLHTWQVPNIKWFATTSLWIAGNVQIRDFLKNYHWFLRAAEVQITVITWNS